MKLFISHSHLDRDYAEAFVDFLTNGIGINHSSIFCSSIDGKSIPIGLNFNEYIQEQINGQEAMVFSIISNNYYNSKFCMYELGAAWGLYRRITPILMPDMTLANLKDFLSSYVAIKTNNITDLNRLAYDLKKTEAIFGEPVPINTYEKERAKLIDRITQMSKRERKLDNNSGKTLVSNYKYKVVAFDFDAVVLQGNNFDYSWKEVWEHLYNDEHDNTRKRLHQKHIKSPNDYSYQEWCDECADYFKKKNFHKRHIREIIKKRALMPASGLLTTLKVLKKHNIVTAIISGGIDTFYEEALSEEYKSKFDRVYFNRFEYDTDGLFTKVSSDAYDFTGKVKALEEVCRFANCNLEEAVFVGEGTNDCDAGSCGCLSIAYPAEKASKAFKEVAKVEIYDDNIAAILGEVLIPTSVAKSRDYRKLSK